MSLSKASVTMQAACAAKLSDQSLRLKDPIGYKIYQQLPDANKHCAMIDQNSNGLFSETVRFRKKYFSEVLDRYAEKYSQLIVLSSGLDFSCLSHLHWQTKTKFFIDHPASLEFSLSLLNQVGVNPSHVTFIALDFEQGNIADTIKKSLLSQNLDIHKPTLILWEGATYYLTKQTILNLFRSLSNLIPMIRIVFDYVLTRENATEISTESEGLNKNLTYIKKHREPWKTTFTKEEIIAQLKTMSFDIQLHQTDIEIQKNYGLHLPDYRQMFAFIEAGK